nr:hypothetical protein [Tanacetum cinerariifolium]
QYSRRATQIAQSKALSPAADEPASFLRDDSQGEAFPIVTSLDAGQDRENIIKTSALPHESSPRVTSLDVDKGNMQQQLQELMNLCTSLQRQQTQMAAKIKDQDLEISGLKARVKILEDKDRGREEPQEDALIKGGSIEIGEEVGVERSTELESNDIEEMVNVLTSMEATNILTSGVAAASVSLVAATITVGVPTISGLVPTVSAILTTTSVVTPNSRRPREISAKDKGKEKVVESDELKMMMIEGLDRSNEMIVKHLHENEQDVTDLSIGEKIELINELSLEAMLDGKLDISEEAERVKRKGLKLDQGSAKKIKTSKEVSEEDLKEMMQLIPVEEATKDKEMELWVELKRLFEPDFEDQLWTHTQNLMHDPLDWKLYDTCGVHRVSTKDQEIFMLVERDYLLRRGQAIVMICNKLQVENYSQMANDLILKIHNIANRIKCSKAFPLPVMKISLLEYFPTVSAKEFPLLSCSVTPAKEFALLMKIRITLSQRRINLSQIRVLVILGILWGLPEADHCQPPQYTVNHPIFNAHNDLLNSQNKLMEQLTSMRDMLPVCYDDDEDEERSISLKDDIISGLPPCAAITPISSTENLVDSLIIRDEHLDTILAIESDEFIMSSVENLVLNPSESEDENECDVLACFTTFLNILFDTNYDFYFVDDQSLSNEEFPMKIYSNPLFDEEMIIFMKIDLHHFNAESDLIESLLNYDSSIISSSSKIDSLFDEFADELTLFKSSPPGISETDCHPEEETHFTKRLFDSLMKEIDLSFTLDYPMLPGIMDDDYDSERDILILEDLLRNDSLLLPEKESFHFDIPSFSRPPAKPPDCNTGILNVKMMDDISEQKVPTPGLMIALVPNQEKSPNLLSHLGFETFQPSAECPMMIHGKNTHILDVPLFHFNIP